MHALIVSCALTQAARSTCLGHADELARVGLIVPAMCLRAYTAIVFGPILDIQKQVVDQIAAASSFE